MTLPELQTLAQILTERLLNTAVEGVVLAGLAWVLLRLIPRQNSGTRFVVWFSTLLAIVAFPFFSGSGFMALHLRADAASPHAQIVLSTRLAVYLFAAWAIGAGMLLLRLSIALWRLRSFRRSCSDLDLGSLNPSAASIVREFESSRSLRLCVSDEATVPSAIGFFRPAVVFPAWLLPHLSAGEFEIILLHELAHLRRRDDWTNLVQKIITAVFFFHPAVWWIASRLTLEREMACDDMVLAKTASPRAYASSLISFAEKLHGSRGLALAQALMSRMHPMSARVAQILDAKAPRRTGLWKPALVLSAAMLVLVLVTAPYVPQVAAFENPAIDSATQPALAANGGADATVIHPAPTMRPVAERVPNLTPQFRAIPAAFHTRTAAVPLRLKAKAVHPPVAIRASFSQEESPMQETILIFRTAQYDASGSGIWTLCIWRVGGGNNAAQRQLESAIVVSLI